MNLSNTNIIVTGAASGIGRAFLLELLQFESSIILVADVDEISLLKTIASLPASTHRWLPFIGDLSKKEVVDLLFEKAKAELGQVNVFVANAGFAYYEDFATTNWERTQRLFELNVFSPLYTIQKMGELNRQKPHYTLITASAMAKLAIPGYAVYGASKAALDRFADAYRFEESTSGKLGLLYPIATRTSFFDHAIQTSEVVPTVPWPSQSAREVAKAMVRGIQKEKRFIYPSLFHRIARFPQQLYEWMLWPYQWYYGSELKKWLGRSKKAE